MLKKLFLITFFSILTEKSLFADFFSACGIKENELRNIIGKDFKARVDTEKARKLLGKHTDPVSCILPKLVKYYDEEIFDFCYGGNVLRFAGGMRQQRRKRDRSVRQQVRRNMESSQLESRR